MANIILVTGAAGFIGFHLCKKLLDMGDMVIGVDNMNNYYDPNLKKARLNILKKYSKFIFFKEDIHNFDGLKKIFQEYKIEVICNLAAQAGVRYSIKDPFSYQKSNMEGFLNIIELARHFKIKNFIYASSSSVYGKNKKVPFSVEDKVDSPVSLYGATKKANELIAHAYHHLYKIPCTGLRYFTVYGPWGRPDMAYFLFTDAIIKEKPIKVFNYGDMKRDFTYIDDIIEGTIAAINKVFPFEIFNLGNSKPVSLMKFIATLEQLLGKEAKKEFLPIQPGDVPETYAEIGKSTQLLGFKPQTPLNKGLEKFVNWYKEYYRV